MQKLRFHEAVIRLFLNARGRQFSSKAGGYPTDSCLFRRFGQWLAFFRNQEHQDFRRFAVATVFGGMDSIFRRDMRNIALL